MNIFRLSILSKSPMSADKMKRDGQAWGDCRMTDRKKLADRRRVTRYELTPELRLSEIAGSRIDAICPGCEHAGSMTATSLMMKHGGAARLVKLLSLMTCSSCGRKGAPVPTIKPIDDSGSEED